MAAATTAYSYKFLGGAAIPLDPQIVADVKAMSAIPVAGLAGLLQVVLRFITDPQVCLVYGVSVFTVESLEAHQQQLLILL